MSELELKLITALSESVKRLFDIDAEPGLIMLEIPNKKEQGDYATNTAMRLTKRVGKNPREIAAALQNELSENPLLDKVEVAGPGFINFFVKPYVLGNVIKTVLEQGDRYGSAVQEKTEKVLVEYVSANPTGQLHVGHARGAAWGDSLTRIMKFAGYDVLREFYVNDLGNQITMLAHSLYARYQEAFGREATIPEDGYFGKDIIEFAMQIAEDEGEKWLDAPQSEWETYFKKTGIDFELERIKNDLEAFRVEFDVWSSEKSLYDDGRVEAVLKQLKEDGYTYESENALWFRSSDFGDDKDRVLIKSDGSYTYLVPDIAYHLYKLQRGYDHLINLWGGDHHGYIARMNASLEALGYKDVLSVDIIQMVRLIEGGVEVKMSKRTGNAIGLIELVDDIGIDATRYFFASRALQTPLDFDLKLARTQSNDNPVYYAQYAHARICSILEQASDMIQDVEVFDLLDHPKEIELLKYVNEFVSTVHDAAKQRAVHKVANYVQQLSAQFHSYYGEVKINDSEAPALTNQRLHLLMATRTTLKNALSLIGVSAPEKM